MRGFSPYNKILLSLFDVSNTFHYSTLVCLNHFCEIQEIYEN